MNHARACCRDPCQNRNPPLIAGSQSSGFYQGQANSLFYDRLGREFTLGVRVKF
jgi:hypothetical protein